MSAPRIKANSDAMTALAWAACITVSWLTIQTVGLAFEALK